MKTLIRASSVIGIAVLFSSCGIFVNKKSPDPVRTEPARAVYTSPFSYRANAVRNYARVKGFSTNYCFLVDMSIHSGRKRFFVYDLETNSVIMAGLVSHGSCNGVFMAQAKFSNAPGANCTSEGKYKIGEKYRGQYGKSYKLYGLENTNSNAYKRAIVLHAYSCIPDEEIYPRVTCNSSGCAGVSPAFFQKLSLIIDRSNKPIVLWIYK
jgi:L,D-transpeptidase-like protein